MGRNGRHAPYTSRRMLTTPTREVSENRIESPREGVDEHPRTGGRDGAVQR